MALNTHFMGSVVWLTGISGAGKTTLGSHISVWLEQRGHRVEFLDGDKVRDFFNNDLGYSREERVLNVTRICFAAKLLAEHGVTVVVANIAPYYEVRDFIRRRLDKYIQIYVKISVEGARNRDAKGHYADFNSGILSQLIGVDDVYDVPRNPDLVIDTEVLDINKSAKMAVDFLAKRGY